MIAWTLLAAYSKWLREGLEAGLELWFSMGAYPDM
jgi:hypothetical protein